jgi:hypothetical protein
LSIVAKTFRAPWEPKQDALAYVCHPDSRYRMESPAWHDVYANDVAKICIETFLALPKSTHPALKSNGIPQHAILAGIVLSKRNINAVDMTHKCIAIATGSKCLPEEYLPLQGNVLHDSHAEVLARRCALRWFYQEIGRCCNNGMHSQWIRRDDNGNFMLCPEIATSLYVSALPCKSLGDCTAP